MAFLCIRIELDANGGGRNRCCRDPAPNGYGCKRGFQTAEDGSCLCDTSRRCNCRFSDCANCRGCHFCCCSSSEQRVPECAEGSDRAGDSAADLDGAEAEHASLHESRGLAKQVTNIQTAEERRDKGLRSFRSGLAEASDVQSLEVNLFALEGGEDARDDAVEKFARALSEVGELAEHFVSTAARPPLVERLRYDLVPCNEKLLREPIRVLEVAAVEHLGEKVLEFLGLGDAAVDHILQLLLDCRNLCGKPLYALTEIRV